MRLDAQTCKSGTPVNAYVQAQSMSVFCLGWVGIKVCGIYSVSRCLIIEPCSVKGPTYLEKSIMPRVIVILYNIQLSENAVHWVQAYTGGLINYCTSFWLRTAIFSCHAVSTSTHLQNMLVFWLEVMSGNVCLAFELSLVAQAWCWDFMMHMMMHQIYMCSVVLERFHVHTWVCLEEAFQHY